MRPARHRLEPIRDAPMKLVHDREELAGPAGSGAHVIPHDSSRKPDTGPTLPSPVFLELEKHGPVDGGRPADIDGHAGRTGDRGRAAQQREHAAERVPDLHGLGRALGTERLDEPRVFVHPPAQPGVRAEREVGQDDRVELSEDRETGCVVRWMHAEAGQKD